MASVEEVLESQMSILQKKKKHKQANKIRPEREREGKKQNR